MGKILLFYKATIMYQPFLLVMAVLLDSLLAHFKLLLFLSSKFRDLKRRLEAATSRGIVHFIDIGGFVLCLLFSFLCLFILTFLQSMNIYVALLLELLLFCFLLQTGSLLLVAQRFAILLEHKYFEKLKLLLGRLTGKSFEMYTENQLAEFSIEYLTVKATAFDIGMVFWAMLGGAPLALIYRGCGFLAAVWENTISRPDFSVNIFLQKLLRLPTVLFLKPVLLLAIRINQGEVKRARLVYKDCRKKIEDTFSCKVLCLYAGALGIRLGGYYMKNQVLHARSFVGIPNHRTNAGDLRKAAEICRSNLYLTVFILGFCFNLIFLLISRVL